MKTILPLVSSILICLCHCRAIVRDKNVRGTDKRGQMDDNVDLTMDDFDSIVDDTDDLMRDDIKRDDITRGDMKRDGFRRDDIVTDDITRGDMKRDDIIREDIEREDIKREDIKREDIEREDIERKDMNIDDVKRDDIIKDEITKRDMKSDVMKRDDIIRGATKRKEIKRHSIKRDGIKKGGIKRGGKGKDNYDEDRAYESESERDVVRFGGTSFESRDDVRTEAERDERREDESRGDMGREYINRGHRREHFEGIDNKRVDAHRNDRGSEAIDRNDVNREHVSSRYVQRKNTKRHDKNFEDIRGVNGRRGDSLITLNDDDLSEDEEANLNELFDIQDEIIRQQALSKKGRECKFIGRIIKDGKTKVFTFNNHSITIKCQYGNPIYII